MLEEVVLFELLAIAFVLSTGTPACFSLTESNFVIDPSGVNIKLPLVYRFVKGNELGIVLLYSYFS